MDITRILLADDHAVVRAGIRNAIEDLPEVTIVGEVGNGPDLIQALETLRPDCLLIDLTMPEFEPIVTTQRIRARYPELLILVVSAYDDDVYVQGLLGAGVNGYHLKDQPLTDLRLAVMRVIAGERWISSPLLEKLLQPADTVPAHLPQLSARQQDILKLLAQGLDNRGIASELGLSVKTIENHLTRLYRQLGVNSRLEAAHFIRENPEIIAQQPPKSSTKHVPDSPGKNGRAAILVVDDNKRYRGQMRRMIGKIYPSAMIFEAGNTAEALQLTQQVTPQLAFVDVVLGDEDGIRCTRRLKALTATLRIVLISAYPDREFHRLGLEAGATAFLDKKDLDTASIQQIVEDILAN